MARRALLLLALSAALGGCAKPRTASVAGVVRLAGRPLADVEVQFIPDPARGTTGRPASAYTDESGRYALDSGLAAGTYVVCLNDATAMMPGRGIDPDSGEAVPGAPAAKGPPRRRLPLIYSDATKTPHRAVRLEPGAQTRDFDLTAAP